MANKLFESLKGQGARATPAEAPADGGFSQLWNQVEQMRQTVQNPQAEVQKLLDSGQMSREEFNRLGQFADQVMRLRPR